ncbi:hypothetical protein [Ilumatobacter coccineus]|uniref:Uncharacterized protein n=1 Tax=Ilumatobacter coccineus (strain NBRC 103263 / KCTC 29153 / YM16-304) TaxID=1313172 RepID=A0A6C7EA05_ILUCY|nr:hypothetical protein [Ilumatobacter coccineus]BAN03557.1 hypothetical protein YM304_32430 [Ilumatobacter coccineus YM16-304]
MTGASAVVIVLTVIVAGAAIVWFMATKRHPERTAGHSDAPPTTTSDELYDGADRPAGPDAEVMDPDLLGGDGRPPRADDA